MNRKARNPSFPRIIYHTEVVTENNENRHPELAVAGTISCEDIDDVYANDGLVYPRA